MSNNGAIQNRHELAARMIEAALEIDRMKIMSDGRRLDEHDIWKVCNKIVGDIRRNLDHSLRVSTQTWYRFEPYLSPGKQPVLLPGLQVAGMACNASYGKMSGTDDYDLRNAAEKVVVAATGTSGVIHVYWECWIREQGQWAAAAWETLSPEQREAVRACIDALEIKAAIKTFQAITHVGLANDKIIDHAADYIKAREAELGFLSELRQGITGVNRALGMPPIQNISAKPGVRFKR